MMKNSNTSPTNADWETEPGPPRKNSSHDRFEPHEVAGLLTPAQMGEVLDDELRALGKIPKDDAEPA